MDDLESNIVKQGQYAKAAALQLDVGWEASPAILLIIIGLRYFPNQQLEMEGCFILVDNFDH